MNNIRSLTVAEYKTHIQWLLKSKIEAISKKDYRFNVPTFVWGPPGIGKSIIPYAISEEQVNLDGTEINLEQFLKLKSEDRPKTRKSFRFIDVRLSQVDPTDLRGVPVYNQKTGIAEFKPFDEILPPDSDIPGVLMLDEFPQATELVQSAAYQLIHDRKIGNYTLPHNIIIIAAGNREEDGGVFFEMPPALKNRFDHIELSTDINSFIDYMYSNNYDENVIAYLMFNKEQDREKIYDFKPEHMNFPTFRSWEKACTKIRYGMNDMIAINDSCGAAIMMDFGSFKDHTRDIPSAFVLVKDKIYFERLDQQLVACQKVGNVILRDSLRENKTDEELWKHFDYFLTLKNPKDKNDDRQEMSILFFTNLKNNFQAFESLNPGYLKAKKTGNIILSKEEEKIDNVYSLVFKRWAILDEIMDNL